MPQKINIAVDGFSSCGKSTLTKALAKKLNYHYLDTGAMYRSITLFFLENNVDFDNPTAVEDALDKITIHFEIQPNGKSHVFLNNEDVEREIRTMRVSKQVSEVATISSVRSFLVKQQRVIAENKGVIMDGRDIGTVVLPNAELKIFMTADKEIRVKRRYEELLQKGMSVTMGEVKANLEHRDFIDSHRADSPLSKAKDAILLDNSHMTQEEQLEYVLGLVKGKLKVESEK